MQELRSISHQLRRKNGDKEVLLAKTKLNSMALIDSNIIHDECALINDVLREYHDMNEEIDNLKTS